MPASGDAATRAPGSRRGSVRHGPQAGEGEAGEQAAQVALPGDAELEGAQAPQHAAVQDEGDQGGQDGDEAALADGAGDQPAEVGEDQTAGADGDGAERGEEPDDE